MTNTTTHGQVPEALIDLIDAYAETRHRCGGIYNAKTEAARKAVIEDLREALGGVQALSAAPAVTSEQRRLIGVIADKIEDGTLFQSGIYPKKDLARFVRNMLDATPTAPAASLTPPAEQAAPKAAPGEPVYREKWDAELGRTAMRFVDRAGDVHPGIDDAETICAEFHKAMSEVIERMPHVQRMAAPKAAPVAQGDALSYEQSYAIRQGHEIASSDAYFKARPQIDGLDRRNVFRAGFERGWDAAIDAAIAAQGGKA